MASELIIEGDRDAESFDFVLVDGERRIPATFWNAHLAQAGVRPALILVQHGGPLHKRHERTEGLVRSIVAGTAAAVLLIDGPIHGARRTEELELMKMFGVFKAYWCEEGGIDTMVADWSTALDVVLDQGWADPGRVAWLGVSMGTAYGIPVCAADTRIRAAAFGMWSLEWGRQERLVEDAHRLKAPVLFQIKSEDEIFSNAGQRELFDAIGSPNKRLSTYPGGHSLTAPGQMDELLHFVSAAFA